MISFRRLTRKKQLKLVLVETISAGNGPHNVEKFSKYTKSVIENCSSNFDRSLMSGQKIHHNRTWRFKRGPEFQQKKYHLKKKCKFLIEKVWYFSKHKNRVRKQSKKIKSCKVNKVSSLTGQYNILALFGPFFLLSGPEPPPIDFLFLFVMGQEKLTNRRKTEKAENLSCCVHIKKKDLTVDLILFICPQRLYFFLFIFKTSSHFFKKLFNDVKFWRPTDKKWSPMWLSERQVCEIEQWPQFTYPTCHPRITSHIRISSYRKIKTWETSARGN